MILISFIIAVYNNEKYLNNAIDSIIKQGFNNCEIIIVDDGSTDKSGEIADYLASIHENIDVIHQNNQWIYASFNNGIKRAKGEYIYILNSDDCLEQNSIKKMANLIYKYHPDVIWTTVKIYNFYNDKRGRVFSGKVMNGFTKEVYWGNTEDIHCVWPYLYECGLAVNQANLYKRELAIAHPFRNDTYGGDTFFNISIADDVKRMAVMADDCYEFNQYFDQQELNVSIGKYYPYEHKMFNEFFTEYYNLYRRWNLDVNSFLPYLIKRRLKNITVEIRHLKAQNCTLSLNEKVYYALNEIPDSFVLSIVSDCEYKEELESRTINGIRELLDSERLKDNDSMYFVQELKDAIDSENKSVIEQKFTLFIKHTANLNHFGSRYLRKIIEEN